MVGVYREEIILPMKGYENGWHNNELDAVFILQQEIDIATLKKQKSEVKNLEFVPIDKLEKEWTGWSDEDIAAKYTPKSREYRTMVITEIRKAMKSTMNNIPPFSTSSPHF